MSDRLREGFTDKLCCHGAVNRPSDDLAKQLNDDRKIQPSLFGPQIRYITDPLLVRSSGGKVPIERIGLNRLGVARVGCCLEFSSSFRPQSLFSHEPPHAPLADHNASISQLFSYPNTAVCPPPLRVSNADLVSEFTLRLAANLTALGPFMPLMIALTTHLQRSAH